MLNYLFDHDKKQQQKTKKEKPKTKKEHKKPQMDLNKLSYWEDILKLRFS